MERIENIRRNDPSVTSVAVYGEHDIVHYGDALQGNTVVDNIVIGAQLHMLTLQHQIPVNVFDSLLHWVQVSPSLRGIKFLCCAQTQLAHLFLLAIANNAGIERVELKFMENCVPANAFASFLRSARPKLKLSLCEVGFDHAGAGDNVAIVQDALRANTALQSLVIEYSALQVYNALLPVLSSCSAITEVALCPPRTERGRGIQVIADFLQSPPSTLEHLHLKGFLHREEGVQTILQHLVVNAPDRMSKVTFRDCSFSPIGATLFKDLFQAKPRIETLVIAEVLYFRGDGQKSGTILGDFVGSNTTLRQLDIGGVDESFLPDGSDDHFSVIFNSLEVNATIERLDCGWLRDDRCSALVKSLPKFAGVKELSFSVTELSPSNKLGLMQAFKQNSSLTKVVIEQDHPDTNVFTAADLKKIAFYTNRNKHAAATFAASTDEVPLSLRPKLYVVVRDSAVGPTQILRDLKRLGDKIGGETSSRKRKHPAAV